MPTRKSFLKSLALVGMGGPWALRAMAQERYPTKPVQVWVGFPAGGGFDVATRVVTLGMVAQGISPIVVMNRPGASGTIAAAQVARAEPDGYSLLLATSANMGAARYLYPKLQFDAERDLVPVAQFAVGQSVIYASAQSGIKTLGQLIEKIRANPGRLNFASPGRGTTAHLCFEMLKAKDRLFIVHVPYNGSPPALSAVVAGELEVGIDAIGPALGFLRSGRLLPLAQTGTRRSASLPHVPTLRELGYADIPVGTYLGFVAPARTPPAIVAELSKAVKNFTASPAGVQQLSQAGMDADYLDASGFGSAMRTELKQWESAVRYSGAANS